MEEEEEDEEEERKFCKSTSFYSGKARGGGSLTLDLAWIFLSPVAYL